MRGSALCVRVPEISFVCVLKQTAVSRSQQTAEHFMAPLDTVCPQTNNHFININALYIKPWLPLEGRARLQQVVLIALRALYESIAAATDTDSLSTHSSMPSLIGSDSSDNGVMDDDSSSDSSDESTGAWMFPFTIVPCDRVEHLSQLALILKRMPRM